MNMAIKGLMVAGAVLLENVSADAAPFGYAYFFGDSLTDCCAFGRYTNGNTPNWADQLPPQIGASFTPSLQTNLAIGGAQSGTTNVIPAQDQAFGAPTGFLSQVGRFQAQGVNVAPNDIAGIWIGTNDIWPSALPTSTSTDGTPVNQPLGIRPGVAALTSYISGNIQTGIQTLVSKGFRNIVLLSPYDLGQAALEPDAASSALATQYSLAVRDAESRFYTQRVNTYLVDVLSLLQEVQANPGAYGFAHTTGQDNCQASGCDSLSLIEQNTFIFADTSHLTNSFNQLIVNRATAVINAGQTIHAATAVINVGQTIYAPVPEPASVALVLAGLAGIGFALGTRKKAA